MDISTNKNKGAGVRCNGYGYVGAWDAPTVPSC